ncbi:MAG: glycosyl hydrolase family 28 protein [Prolixibacteraceae bacterium]
MQRIIKFHLGLFLLLLVGFSLNAQVPEKIELFSTPFGDFNFERPQFPDKTVNILEYGAQSGGTFKNTKAINKAITTTSESGGGRVLVPKGTWLTGPIVLKSNVNLHLVEGAELLFSQDFSDYLPAVLTNWEGSEVYSYSPFIYAYEQENIAITGKGTLNGQGKPWWELRKNKAFGNYRLAQMNEDEVPVKERIFDNTHTNYLPPVFFGPLYCKNVLLEGIRFEYGAFWTVNPSFCTNLIIRDIYILTYGEYGHTPNGDGINPNSCQNVLIEYNTLDTGDDCITLKSGRNKDGRRLGIPEKNILIRHNTGLQGHGGIVVGSEMSGGVENVYAHDCNFYGTDRIVRLKTGRGRGAYIRNCWFIDLEADTITREAIRINMLYGDTDKEVQEVNEGTPVIENIHIENLSCKYAKSENISIIGLPEMPVKNVTMKNISIGGKTGVHISNAKNITIENLWTSNQKGSAITVDDCDSISINNLTITSTDVSKTPIVLTNVNNSAITNFNILPQELIKITGNSEHILLDEYLPKNRIINNAKK